MDREPDGVDDAGSRAPGAGGSRRLIVAGLAAGVVLLLVIAVLATLARQHARHAEGRGDGQPDADARPRP